MEWSKPSAKKLEQAAAAKRAAETSLVAALDALEGMMDSGWEDHEDPAGDDYPEETLAPAMIAAIKDTGLKSEL